MPPAFEVLLLNTTIPQIQAAQSGDTYVVPRDIAFSTVASFAAGAEATPSIVATGDTNTGIWFPAADTVAISTGGISRLRLDSSGNLGLGVTPSAWASDWKVMQIGGRSAFAQYNVNASAIVANNVYFAGAGGSNPTYIDTAAASFYQQVNGQHNWYNAASGTAGNAITFTQAMTLDASGNLLVGTASSGQGRLMVKQGASTVASGVAVQATSNDSYLSLWNDGSVFNIEAYYNSTGSYQPIAFRTSNIERARITSGGDLYINTQSAIDSAYKVQLFFASGGGISIKTGTDGDNAMGFRNSSGTSVGSIVINTAGTAYNTSSDYRLKDNQQPLTGSGAFIDALKPKTWDWKSGGKGVGFIAHEVAEISPGTVVGTKDAVDEEGKPIMQAMEYGSAEFIANIIAELQSLRARVAQLEQGA